MAYELNLPKEMSAIHNIFHISMLKKYVSDPDHVIKLQTVQVQEDLSYEDGPIEILDREARVKEQKDCIGKSAMV